MSEILEELQAELERAEAELERLRDLLPYVVQWAWLPRWTDPRWTDRLRPEERALFEAVRAAGLLDKGGGER